MTRKTIAIVGIGGTISMTQGPKGLTPTQSAQDLLGAVAAAHPSVTLKPVDLMRKPSASLTGEDVAELARTIEELANNGADGVVVTQGTDTLEEVAFAIELTTAAPIPVVFTGSMRGASALGYDGGANLDDAIRVALHATGRSEVFVVMNAETHAPRFVAKTHTSSLASFRSPDTGPLMRIHEGAVYEHARLKRAPHIAAKAKWPRVATIQLGLGDDGALLPQLKQLGYAGCILAATGGGHVADYAVAGIEQAAKEMPVVLCSRAGAGRVFERTYGYPGAETDLLKRGVIAGGVLSPAKARVLLLLCLAQNAANAASAFAAIAGELASVRQT